MEKKEEGKRKRGRLKGILEDNINMNFKETRQVMVK